MEKELFRERSKYKELIDDIEVEKVKLQEERSEMFSLRNQEKKLNSGIKKFEGEIERLRGIIDQEEKKVEVTEGHIEYFEKVAEKLKDRIRAENEKLKPLIEESKKQEEKIVSLQEEVLTKVMQGRKRIREHMDNSTKAAGKFKTFLKQKSEIESMLEKVDRQKDLLSEEMVGLIKKAQAFDLASKKSNVKKYMTELNKKFSEIEGKRDNLKKELSKLVRAIKKSF
jgi:chromosome segregation ATPase